MGTITMHLKNNCFSVSPSYVQQPDEINTATKPICVAAYAVAKLLETCFQIFHKQKLKDSLYSCIATSKLIKLVHKFECNYNMTNLGRRCADGQHGRL